MNDFRFNKSALMHKSLIIVSLALLLIAFFIASHGYNSKTNQSTSVALDSNNSPQSLLAPSGSNWAYITQAAQIAIINNYSSNQPSHFQYEITVNMLNFSSIAAPNLQNIGFFYENGTQIPSTLLTTGTDLNAQRKVQYLLDLNATVPWFNEPEFNASLQTNLNHPSCAPGSVDSQLADPTAVHGIYINFGAFPDQTTNYILKSTGYQYLSPDPRICGILLDVGWKKIEPEPGVYNWSYISNRTSPWINAGKYVAIAFWNGQNATPSWVLNEAPNISCNQNGQTEPIFWEDPANSSYKQFIQTVINHYNNNASISYLRFGMEGDVFLSPYGDGPTGYNMNCANLWASAGLTQSLWQNFISGMMGYINSLHSKKQVVLFLNHWYSFVGGGPLELNETGLAIDYGIGMGSEAVSNYSDFGPWSKDGTCNNNLCNTMTLYQGRIPFDMQPSGPTGPLIPGVCIGSGTLPQHFVFDLLMHAQLMEYYGQDYLLADDSNYSGYEILDGNNGKCPDLLTYAQWSPSYNAILTEAANVVGYVPSDGPFTTTASNFHQQNTSLNIYLGFAPVSTTLQGFTSAPAMPSNTVNLITEMGSEAFPVPNSVPPPPPLTVPTPTPTTQTVLQGVEANIMDMGASGGVVPYHYQWLIQAPGQNSYSSITGATSNSYSFNTLSATIGTYNFEFSATDNAMPMDVANSMPVTVTVVSTSLAIATPTPSTQTVDQGSTANIVGAAATAGTGVYSYQWLEEAPGNVAYLNANNCASQTSTTCLFQTFSSTKNRNIQFRTRGY